MNYVFWMTGSYGSHPDEHYDPNASALPVIENINYQDMVAENVTMPAQLAGITGDQFTGICISNVTITLSKKLKKVLWNCTDVSGYTSGVTPEPCQLLPEKQPGTVVPCNFPESPIPIDEVRLQRCYSRRRLL
ncbi:hypothetical protein Bca52824_090806 [Brassica carinata]|uniref:Polygalacturonase n=1 Tax=Brassica carinata TaxID=52824 RepID=A0A8X7TGL4_BRACI|nr:hypothetical protein Bca52824_090806 [Brassica carinata]